MIIKSNEITDLTERLKTPMRLFSWLRTSAITVAITILLGMVSTEFSTIGTAAAQPYTVTEIVVEGNTRIEAETIETYLTIQRELPFTDSDLDDSLKEMFATGLFTDVGIERRGETLVVTVTENALIRQISFEGNSRIADEALQEVIQSEEREVLTQTRVQGDLQLILESYRRIGRYRASVEPKYIELENNRVDLVFEINEGTKTKIERITFIGNRNFSDLELRGIIQTREAGFFSFLRTSDVYDPDRFDADQELLRRFYFQQGYADFRIVSAIADLDREQNLFYLTITIDEGVKYKYADINIDTTLISVDPEELKKVVVSESGDTYDSGEIETSVENITVEVSKLGFAFAEVRPRFDRNFEERTIDVTFVVEEGPRVYIDRINITGNNRTREYVIRRELDLAEGDAFNRILLDASKRRLDNLQYFRSVNLTTERGSAPDRIIINIEVTEQPTGEVSFGVGYSTSDGFVGDVSISEKNFLGRGQYVKIAGSYGESSRTYELAVREPYFAGLRVSSSFNVVRRTLTENDSRSYDETSTGGGASFGFPLNEAVSLNTFYRLTNSVRTSDNSSVSTVISSSATDDENDEINTRLTSLIGFSLVYNTIDNFRLPRRGLYGRLKEDVTGLGGDSQYFRTEIEGRAFTPIITDWDLIGMIEVKGGHVQSWGERLSVFDQYFIGGETIRGFRSQGVGPRDGNRDLDDAVGGRTFFSSTAELTFPTPLLPDELGLRGALFLDAGSAWGFDTEIAEVIENEMTRKTFLDNLVSNEFELRVSAGFGFAWDSPFGQIRADFAWPLLKNERDKTEIFRLGGGSQF